MKPLFITTPIYYVNDSPHLGHAYTTIATDIMARTNRLLGRNVKFLTGTDEHGQKIDKAAKAAGRDAQEFTDEVSLRFKVLANVECINQKSENLLNISNTDYIRTTEPRHKKAAAALWKILEDNGHIYLDKYAGWYSVRDEAYYQESELVNGKAPTGADVEWLEEESYFFDLSKWQDKLLEFYENNPDFVIPKERYNEVVSFVKGGLKDLSVSRTNFSWGIPVPNNEKHVMYVWLDALTNYLTSAGFPEVNGDEFNKFWKNADVVHVVGKDILRFHAVYWPAFLMAAKLPVPKQIVAHGWWTIEGEKMSKSLGNVISPQELVNAYGLDQTRYFLLKAMPFGNDGDLSKDRLKEIVNADLANNIGNFAQRILSMIFKNLEGIIPAKKDEVLGAEEKALFDDLMYHVKITKNIREGNLRFEQRIMNFDFFGILNDLVAISSKCNEVIDKTEPWKLKSADPEKFATTMYYFAESIRCIGIMLQPYCPAAAGKILDILKIPESERTFEFINENIWLKSGTQIEEPKGVFPRII